MSILNNRQIYFGLIIVGRVNQLLAYRVFHCELWGDSYIVIYPYRQSLSR